MTESIDRTDDVFDIDRIRQLIELMKEHELGEIDLRRDNQRIRLCSAGYGQSVMAPTMLAPHTVASMVSAPAVASVTSPEDDGPHITYIKSPMVGTFYTRPNPNAKNFVETGSSVQNDTIICIIEAMKVFNEIPAEMRGKVVQVLVKNEEAVDFGKPLFKIDTRG